MLSVLLAAVLLRELPLGLVWSSDGVVTTLTFIFVKVFTVRTLLQHMSLTILFLRLVEGAAHASILAKI